MHTNAPLLPIATRWTNVSEFVIDTVSRCDGETAYSNGQLSAAVRGLATWAQTDSDEFLSIGAVFAREHIELYVDHGLTGWAPASRGNVRSMLFRMSESLGASTSTRSSAPLPAARPSQPYDLSDISQIRVWVAEQIGERAKDASILVALGLGAGLSAAEIRAVRIRDIREAVSDDGISHWFVDVLGTRARGVQLEEGWLPNLREGIEGRKPEDWAYCPKRVGGGKNLISNFVSRYGTDGKRPSTQRMRATWLVGRMSDGTPVFELRRMAGVTSLDALDRYVGFVG